MSATLSRNTFTCLEELCFITVVISPYTTTRTTSTIYPVISTAEVFHSFHTIMVSPLPPWRITHTSAEAVAANTSGSLDCAFFAAILIVVAVAYPWDIELSLRALTQFRASTSFAAMTVICQDHEKNTVTRLLAIIVIPIVTLITDLFSGNGDGKISVVCRVYFAATLSDVVSSIVSIFLLHVFFFLHTTTLKTTTSIITRTKTVWRTLSFFTIQQYIL